MLFASFVNIMQKEIPYPSMDLVCQVIRDDKDSLLILGLDDYNKLFTSTEVGTYDEGGQALQGFCNAFGYITAVAENTLCLFSGTMYSNMKAALLGSTYLAQEIFLDLNSEQALFEIVHEMKTRENYEYLNKSVKEIPFATLVRSTGGHMCIFSVAFDAFHKAKHDPTDYGVSLVALLTMIDDLRCHFKQSTICHDRKFGKCIFCSCTTFVAYRS
jgi:hypothetical protein